MAAVKPPLGLAEPPPEPDRTGTSPHPRHTATLLGQSSAEAAFLDAFGAGRLHHAWLLSGSRGIGKATLAWRIARFLIAEPAPGGMFAAPMPQSLDTPLDTPAARQIAALAHPNLHLLRREWDEKAKRLRTEITVDPVRELHRFLALSVADGGRRVVIVDAADEMNTAAANALLKVLEEPPARTTFLLVTHRPARLLPTIRSRCRGLPLVPLSDADLSTALANTGTTALLDPATRVLAQGSVGAAVALLEAGGGALYTDLVALWARGAMDRPQALRLADSLVGAKNRPRLEMFLALYEHFLARLARSGLMGPPTPEAAPGEAALMARLCPHDQAARAWAALSARALARARHGLGVNLDPGALVLDMLGAIDAEARKIA